MTRKDKVFNAIKEIVAEKKRQRIHPPIATIREVVDRTEMQLPDINGFTAELLEGRQIKIIQTINSKGFELL